MNKKGAAMLGILVGFLFFISGALFIQHMGDSVISSRVGLSCTDVGNITDGTKVTCLIVDLAVPYFIMGILSIAVGYAGGVVR